MKKTLLFLALPLLAFAQPEQRLTISVSEPTLNSLLATVVESGALNQTEEAFTWTTVKVRFLSATVEMQSQTQKILMNVSARVYTHVNTWPFDITDTRTISFPVYLNPSVQEVSGGKLIRLCPESVPSGFANMLSVSGLVIAELNKIFDDPKSCFNTASFGTVLPNFPSHMIQESFQFYIYPDRLALGVGIKTAPGPAKNRAARLDFDGDGKADLGAWIDRIPLFGPDQWMLDYSYNEFDPNGLADALRNLTIAPGMHPVPGDYDGDGLTDLAVYNGGWSIDFAHDGFQNNSFNTTLYSTLPTASYCKPVPADYDGDRLTDLAVFCIDGAGYANWYIDYSINSYGTMDFAFGGDDFAPTGLHPVPADYDGDGKADLAVKSDESGGLFAIKYAATFGGGWWDLCLNGWGDGSYVPAPADYDGDGKTDLAVMNKDGYSTWYVDYAANGFTQNGTDVYSNADDYQTPFGSVPLTPVPSDYDGDGKADFAGKSDYYGSWHIDYSGNGFGSQDVYLAGWGDETYTALKKGSVTTGLDTKNGMGFVTFVFDLEKAARGRVDIYGPDGKKVANLFDGGLHEGPNKLTWARDDFSNKGLKRGVYLLRLEAGGYKTSRRLMLTD